MTFGILPNSRKGMTKSKLWVNRASCGIADYRLEGLVISWLVPFRKFEISWPSRIVEKNNEEFDMPLFQNMRERLNSWIQRWCSPVTPLEALTGAGSATSLMWSLTYLAAWEINISSRSCYYTVPEGAMFNWLCHLLYVVHLSLWTEEVETWLNRWVGSVLCACDTG